MPPAQGMGATVPDTTLVSATLTRNRCMNPLASGCTAHAAMAGVVTLAMRIPGMGPDRADSGQVTTAAMVAMVAWVGTVGTVGDMRAATAAVLAVVATSHPSSA